MFFVRSLAPACGRPERFFWRFRWPLLLAGCNVFSPLAADGDGDLTYRGLLLKGNAAVNDARFADAVGFFARAKALNPRGSEAYLNHSKALVGQYKIDYNSLNDEFNRRRGKIVNGLPPKKGIPFIDSTTTIAGIDSIYYPVAQSVENLEHILRRPRDTIFIPGGFKLLPDGDTASDGRVTEGVARLDLGLLQTIKGMLGPLDLDGDNHISVSCGANLCPGLQPACMSGSVYLKKCKEGPASEFNGFTRFKALTRSINIDNLDTKDMRARELLERPQRHQRLPGQDDRTHLRVQLQPGLRHRRHEQPRRKGDERPAHRNRHQRAGPEQLPGLHALQ